MSLRLLTFFSLLITTAASAQNNGSASLDALIKQLDTNGDGRVSKSEATGRYADRFTQWDANNDGFATRDEIRAYRLSIGLDDAGNRAQQRPRPAATATVLMEPPDWRLENLPMPPGFARDITLRGSEEIRFAPGMFKTDASDYFTCVIAITIDDRATMDAEDLKDFLQKYYRGLSGSRATRSGATLDTATLTAKVRLTAEHRFEGTMDFLDSFNDGRRITLNVEAQTFAKPVANQTILLLLVSPSAKDSAVWKTLHEIGAKTLASLHPTSSKDGPKSPGDTAVGRNEPTPTPAK